jgi:hypothetical protein
MFGGCAVFCYVREHKDLARGLFGSVCLFSEAGAFVISLSACLHSCVCIEFCFVAQVRFRVKVSLFAVNRAVSEVRLAVTVVFAFQPLHALLGRWGL